MPDKLRCIAPLLAATAIAIVPVLIADSANKTLGYPDRAAPFDGCVSRVPAGTTLDREVFHLKRDVPTDVLSPHTVQTCPSVPLGAAPHQRQLGAAERPMPPTLRPPN